MARRPVHASPWVIALLLVGLLLGAWTLHLATRPAGGHLPPPVRGAAS